MTKITVGLKDEIVMKILHFFVTEENYRPIIVNGVQNEIWLENLDNDISLIRININYIHNDEQLKTDMRKCEAIRRTIKRKTYKLKMNMINILLDVRDEVTPISDKSIESIKINKVGDLKKNEVINSFFPTFKEKVSGKKSGLVGMFKMTDELNEKTTSEDKKLAKVFKPSKYPVVTISLIMINILVFMLTLFKYDSIILNFGNYYEFLKLGQVYRLITSMFIHANIFHLFFNMYALFIVGPEVERYYGKLKYLLIYLGSGVIGGLFSAVLNNSIGVGASGAIFGLFASLLYFGLKYRATLDGILRGGIIPVLLINLLIGAIYPSIDLFAHIGGLIGGLLFSYTLCVPNKGSKTDHINGTILTILLIGALTYILLAK